MDLRFTKTSKGAVVSIHIGKTLTTNLFKEGWLETDNPDIIAKFRSFIRQARYASDADQETKLIENLVSEIKSAYDPSKIFKPYRRERTSKSGYVDIKYDGVISIDEGAPTDLEASTTKSEADISDKRRQVAKDIIKFFSEFTFVPAARFVNTLSQCSSYAECKKYVNDYMNLVDHPDKNEICEKIKSDEFKNITTNLMDCKGDKQINQRLEIYYGPAGTGKTTEAIKLYPEANVTVCNELMDSDAIMKVFDFNDENGHPVFKPSQLQLDMIEGRPHILDEMNLLPMNTLRFLQGILDSKEKINYEGKEIVIKDGFKIIGTMNLVVNGQVFNLPEPIVDRAYKLKEYKADEKLLADFAF